MTRSRTVTVKVVPLDSMKGEVGQVRAIFVDTEGAEVDVLSGAVEVVSISRAVIVLEASPRLLARSGKSMGDLQGVLTDLGYTAREITRFGLASPMRADLGRAANWLCLPDEKADLTCRISRYILLCGALPCIAGINPMTRRAAS